MKKIFLSTLTAMLIVCCAVPALAVPDIQSKALFNLYSSAVSTVTNSTPLDTGLRTKKTVIVNGMGTYTRGEGRGTKKISVWVFYAE